MRSMSRVSGVLWCISRKLVKWWKMENWHRVMKFSQKFYPCMWCTVTTSSLVGPVFATWIHAAKFARQQPPIRSIHRRKTKVRALRSGIQSQRGWKNEGLQPEQADLLAVSEHLTWKMFILTQRLLSARWSMIKSARVCQLLEQGFVTCFHFDGHSIKSAQVFHSNLCTSSSRLLVVWNHRWLIPVSVL